MRIDSNADFITFLISIIVGIALSILYDIFKSFRKAFKCSALNIVFQDILFSFISAIVTYTLLFVRVYGEIRLFVLIAVFFGAIFERKTVSKHIVKFFYKVLRIIKRILFVLNSLFRNLSNRFYSFTGKIKEKFVKISCKITKKSV